MLQAGDCSRPQNTEGMGLGGREAPSGTWGQHWACGNLGTGEQVHGTWFWEGLEH